MTPLRRVVAVVAAATAVLVLAACSVSTSDKPAVPAFNPLDPGPTSSSSTPGPDGPDLQLRPVLTVERAALGDCPKADPPTPPAGEPATLCSADLTTVLGLGPAVVSGPHVKSVDAGTVGDTPTVRVALDVTGATALANSTLRLSQQPSPRDLLAVVSHGRVQSAPVVTDQITGGVLDLSGFATADDARAAAALFGG